MSADVEIKSYRTYHQLLTLDEYELSSYEKERLANIRKIPDKVRETLEIRAEELRKNIIDLEAERDNIIDFLNGEWEA